MASDPERIVVFLPNWVGDAVMFTPALRALRRRFGGAALTLAARPAAAAVLTPNPWTDEMLIDRGSLVALVRALRRGRFDLAVLGPNSFRSALSARLGGAGRRAGYDRDGRGWLLTDRVRPPRGPDGRFAVTAAIDYYLALAEALGADADDRRMELAVAEADDLAAAKLLADAGADPRAPVVLLNPGAAYGPAKMYPPQRFAAVADALIDRRGAQIVINAAPGERPVAEAVADAMRHAPRLNLARLDNTLGLLKALARRAALTITNDTGSRHVAAALGAAVVTIFGPTDPGWARLDCPRERIVRADVPCGPCQRKACPLPDGAGHHQCMLKISPEQVVEAAEELLAPEGRT